jgi:hypothetical protein
VIVTLLFSIAGGMLTIFGTARVTDFAWKYIRLIGLLTLAVGCLATISVYRDIRFGFVDSPWWFVASCGLLLAVGAMGLVITAPMVSRVPMAVRALSLTGGVAGVAGGVLSCLLAVGTAKLTPFVAFLIAVGQVLGSWMLGSITVAWLLGHAYLTATKMTIAPLRYFSGMLSVAVGARIVFFVIALVAAWLTQECSPDSVCTRIEQWWIIVLLRVGVGLIALAIFAYMVRDCVRLRSTQSATGILYFASVMAYIGELASQYLTRELVWPI